MSTGDFASIEEAAAAAGIALTPLGGPPKRAPRDTLRPPSPEHETQGAALASITPVGPDAPLGPKKPAAERALYGGPASEKPTRVEGDAPAPGGYPAPIPQKPRNTWSMWAIGAVFVALGVLVALLLKS